MQLYFSLSKFPTSIIVFNAYKKKDGLLVYI